jgi:hypothetical protein
MYYRKYFSGVVATLISTLNETYTPTVGAGGSTQRQYRSMVTTPILCNAIMEVFQEIGLTDAACHLDPAEPDTYGEIFPYGTGTQGVHVYFGSATMSNLHSMCRVGIGPDADINTMGSASSSIGLNVNFNMLQTTTGTDVPYQFYVTVKGDPVSFLRVFVSSYNTLDTETELFSFGKGKDCFGNNIVCYSPQSVTTNLLFFDLDERTYVNQIAPTYNVSDSAVSHSQNETIVKGCPTDTIALIPWSYNPLLGVSLDNCYCVPMSLTTATSDQAFLINGEEYWLLKNGRILARCSTKLPVR